MKLNAIVNRGTKKDLIDLFYLLKEQTLESIISDYTLKYGVDTTMMIRKAIVFFEDADIQPMPHMFDTIDWEEIKTTIKEHAIGIA